jgi:hypothetical protein
VTSTVHPLSSLMAWRARASALLCLALGSACGGATPRPEPGGETASRPEPTPTNDAAERTEAPPPETPGSPPLSSVPECDVYLRLYERCEPTLAPSITHGDRRDFAHERAWLEYLAGTPEVAGLPMSCRNLLRELQDVCP